MWRQGGEISREDISVERKVEGRRDVALGFTHQRWWLSSEGGDKKTIEGAEVNSAR